MKITPQLLATALSALFSKIVSFRLGNYLVTASLNGTPTHLTFGQVITAGEMVLGGTVGTFAVGDVQIMVSPWVGA